MVKFMVIVLAGLAVGYLAGVLLVRSVDVRAARNLKGRAQGFSGCFRCGDSWSWKAHHNTQFSESEACFPLCEECWAALTPEARWPYYEKLIADWGLAPDSRQSLYLTALGEPPKADLIREAVMAGK